MRIIIYFIKTTSSNKSLTNFERNSKSKKWKHYKLYKYFKTTITTYWHLASNLSMMPWILRTADFLLVLTMRVFGGRSEVSIPSSFSSFLVNWSSNFRYNLFFSLPVKFSTSKLISSKSATTSSICWNFFAVKLFIFKVILYCLFFFKC